MSDEANKETAADKEAKNKARREKIEKIALKIKDVAIKTGQTLIPIAKKGVAFVSTFIKAQLEKIKQKASASPATLVTPTAPSAKTEPPKADQNPPQ
jgi:hypothetical protein